MRVGYFSFFCVCVVIYARMRVCYIYMRARDITRVCGIYMRMYARGIACVRAIKSCAREIAYMRAYARVLYLRAPTHTHIRVYIL